MAARSRSRCAPHRCRRHGLCKRLGRGLLQVGDCPPSHGHPEQSRHDVLGRALRHVIGPGAQGHHRLHPGAEASSRHADRHRRPHRFVTRRADQAMPLLLCHHRLHGWNLRHVMPRGLRIRSRPRGLTAGTTLRLDRDDDIDLLNRPPRPCWPLVPGLPARPPPTGLAAGPLAHSRERLARRRPRRRPRGLLPLRSHLLDRSLQLLGGSLQPLDGLLQGSSPRFERADVGLGLRWDALPHPVRYTGFAVHEPAWEGTSALAGKGVSP